MHRLFLTTVISYAYLIHEEPRMGSGAVMCRDSCVDFRRYIKLFVCLFVCLLNFLPHFLLSLLSSFFLFAFLLIYFVTRLLPD